MSVYTGPYSPVPAHKLFWQVLARTFFCAGFPLRRSGQTGPLTQVSLSRFFTQSLPHISSYTVPQQVLSRRSLFIGSCRQVTRRHVLTKALMSKSFSDGFLHTSLFTRVRAHGYPCTGPITEVLLHGSRVRRSHYTALLTQILLRRFAQVLMQTVPAHRSPSRRYLTQISFQRFLTQDMVSMRRSVRAGPQNLTHVPLHRSLCPCFRTHGFLHKPFCTTQVPAPRSLFTGSSLQVPVHKSLCTGSVSQVRLPTQGLQHRSVCTGPIAQVPSQRSSFTSFCPGPQVLLQRSHKQVHARRSSYSGTAPGSHTQVPLAQVPTHRWQVPIHRHLCTGPCAPALLSTGSVTQVPLPTAFYRSLLTPAIYAVRAGSLRRLFRPRPILKRWWLAAGTCCSRLLCKWCGLAIRTCFSGQGFFSERCAGSLHRPLQLFKRCWLAALIIICFSVQGRFSSAG